MNPFGRALLYVAILISLASCSHPLNVPDQAIERPPPRAAAPKTPPQIIAHPDDVILRHKYFEVRYDRKFRLARYVKYTLTKEHLLAKLGKRKDHFIPDPMLDKNKERPVVAKDYARSGYDKGHLAPAADFSFDQDAVDETFVMSNMAPQKPGLNRSAWRLLEEQVRKWACGEERVIVITGPILEAKLPTLKSGVPIPKQFFKIVIDDTPPRKALAFVYNQEDKGQVMGQRLVPLHELEQKLKESFSPLLQDDERTPAQTVEWKECAA